MSDLLRPAVLASLLDGVLASLLALAPSISGQLTATAPCREAHSKEESAHRAFAILFSLIMVYELEETWLLYVNAIKAQVCFFLS